MVGQRNDYSNGVGGAAKIRIRYGSSLSGGQLEISIADEIQTTINLETLPQVDGQDVAFTETPSIDVTFPNDQPDFNITFRYLGDTSVIIDEFTVSNADDIAQAQVHLRAAQLNSTQLTNLVTYVSSLDQVSAPSDNETDIFTNSDEPDNSDNPDSEVAVGTVVETVLKTKHDRQTYLRAGSLLRRHSAHQRLAQSAGQPQCQRSCIKIGSEPNYIRHSSSPITFFWSTGFSILYPPIQ